LFFSFVVVLGLVGYVRLVPKSLSLVELFI
jgi:hypothetical protein